MKKRYVIIAALAGVMSLSGCVDSNESASIEAVHKAKAEQLAALANLNNAQADAKKVAANAEAERIQAEAAAKKAQTEIEKIDIEMQKVLLEKDKVERDLAEALLDTQKEQLANELALQKKNLELQIAQLNIDKAEWEKQIDQIKYELANSEANLKNELARLEVQRQRVANELQLLIDNKDNALKKQLETLLDEYNVASNDLSIALNALASDKADLITLQYKLAGLEETLTKNIAQWEIEIANNEAKKEVYLAYVDKDYDKTKADADAALETVNRLTYEYNAAYTNCNNYNTTNVAVALKAYRESKYKECINSYNSYLPGISGATYKVFDGTETAETGKITYKLGEKSVDYIYTEYKQLTVNKELFGYYIETLEKSAADSKKVLEGLEKTYNDNVKATATAKEAWEKAAEADKATKKAEYEAAITAMNAAEENLNNYQPTYDGYKKDLDTVKEDYAYLISDAGLAEYKKVVDALNAELKAYANLFVLFRVADYNYSQANAKYNALVDLLGSKIDAATLIERCDEQIAKLQQWIDQAKNTMTSYKYKDENGNIYSDYNYQLAIEAAIELQKIRIEAGELAVAAFEKRVTDIQAEIDGLMNGK